MKILICPLNWGLGHATRCIPLIEDYLKDGNEVVVAADGYPLILLQQEFPDIQFIELPSYDFSYSRGKSQVSAMFRSLPNIISGIFREHQQLKKILENQLFDVVISDNRFGMWNKKVKSVYMTHQVRIIMPRKLKWAEPIIKALHLFIINQYDECLIPDYPGEKNLSGELSHGFPLPKHVHYIGPLSRFRNFKQQPAKNQYELVALVSGPEPQRSVFESELTGICLKSGKKSLLIRGLPGHDSSLHKINQLSILPHLPSHELATVLCHAYTIYCRSGYSTIMDLEALGCLEKAIMIATPGQTEQEYLEGLHGH
jgi:predicted glycosyltransferase